MNLQRTSLGKATESRPPVARHFAWIAVVVFALTFLKGFRLPNLWVATHFAFNYSQGFVRRGLVGEVARVLGRVEVYRYNAIVVVSFVVMALVLVTYGIVIKKALRAQPTELGLRVALLVFLSSPGLVFFVHAVGYNDYFGLLFALLFLLIVERLRRWYGPLLLAAALGLVLAFIHEALAVMFGPLMVFVVACFFARSDRLARLSATRTLVSLGAIMLTGALVFGLSGLVSTLGQEDLTRVRALERYIRDHADFPLRVEAFDALRRSSAANISSLMPWYWSKPYHVQVASLSWQAFVPGMVWLLVYGCRAVLDLRLRLPLRAGLLIAFVAASIAPLFLNFVGWDWNRWNGLALVACFAAIATIKIYFPTFAGSRRDRTNALGICLCAVALASTTPLFDGMEVQFFPFEKQRRFMQELIDGDFTYRPRG